jgi:hypothetical protein
MSGSKKILLIVLGALSAMLIVAQLVLGVLIKTTQNVRLVTPHEHLGYSTVVILLVYIFFSLATIAAIPTARR